ncbi:phosphate metabolism protein 7 [Oleoguttula sp. CCFEE 5521]
MARAPNCNAVSSISSPSHRPQPLTASQQGTDANVGSAQGSQGASITSVITTLVPVIAFAAVWAVLFLFLRKKFPRNYQPRTFLGSLRENERSPKMPNGLFNWVGEFWRISDTYVLNHHSLDGYLFLRLLKIATVICLVGCLIMMPVLFPINATGGGGKSGFDLLTMANVTNNYFKLFAHAGCAVIFFSFVVFMITRESIYFINLRQAYLMSPYYASRLSSRTVLYTSVPADYMNETKLRRMLGPAVRRVWPVSDVKELEDLVEDRDKAAMKLEGAEVKLITTANGARIKAAKKGGRENSDQAHIADSEQGSLAGRYLKPKQRPTHRLKPLIGKKVDTIDWCRGELNRLNPKIDEHQAVHRRHEATLGNSVFVEFQTLSDAQAAYQSLTHHHVLHMAPRYTGMVPDDVIWGNLKIKWWERIIRQIVCITFVVVLVIFWSVPVAFVGAISHVDKLTCLIPAFNFIYNLPEQLLGLITGLLPVVLLAVLMALLPIILRLAAKLSGAPTHSAVEYTVQNYYFAFQVVQVFLVATLGSAASSSVQTIIKNPGSVTSLLANNLPTASTFYLSYFILQGLGVMSGVLVGLVGLIIFLVLGKLLDKTPRKMYNRWIKLAGMGWGTVFPVFTNLLVIAICYAAIAPLVLLFAAIGLYLFYFAYRYNLLFVTNATLDTKGAVYPRALQQVFVGLYIAEVCLIGLFAISSGASVGALGPLIIMIIFLIFTALYHLSLNAALGPHLAFLPKSIDAEERRLLAQDRGEPVTDGYDEGIRSKEGNSSGTNGHAAPFVQHKKPNMFTKFLRPDIYTDYETMRQLVPKDIAIEYDEFTENHAFYNPAITSERPLLWIPRDPVGISRQEVRDTEKVNPITDEGAFLDEKNKVTWDSPQGRPPIYQEKVYY